MKLLLLGGNGQVGRELRRSLLPLGELLVATRDGGDADLRADFDVPESLPALIARIAPDVVVNAAAYTAVDKAETDAAAAFRINADAVAAIARACAACGALLVHYSTDYVFDGGATQPYREDHATTPLGAYGESKLAGEQAIRASGARHAILRTAWVYASHGKNFLLTMLRMAGEREELRVVADQVGAPTPAAWLRIRLTCSWSSSRAAWTRSWSRPSASACRSCATAGARCCCSATSASSRPIGAKACGARSMRWRRRAEAQSWAATGEAAGPRATNRFFSRSAGRSTRYQDSAAQARAIAVAMAMLPAMVLPVGSIHASCCAGQPYRYRP